jgi:nucleoside 2-deoxyribosyltransferase
MMKKIYLAGSCATEQRTDMMKIAKLLRTCDFEVYCPFELKIPDAWDMSQEAWAQKVFDADIKAIDECDIFFMVSPGRESTAGTNWEQGYAYAKGKRVIVAQYTDKPTSLMTYCGADEFFNFSSVNNLLDDLLWIFFPLVEEPYQTGCKTTLT